MRAVWNHRVLSTHDAIGCKCEIVSVSCSHWKVIQFCFKFWIYYCGHFFLLQFYQRWFRIYVSMWIYFFPFRGSIELLEDKKKGNARTRYRVSLRPCLQFPQISPASRQRSGNSYWANSRWERCRIFILVQYGNKNRNALFHSVSLKTRATHCMRIATSKFSSCHAVQYVCKANVRLPLCFMKHHTTTQKA